MVISTLGDKTYAELSAPGGREHAKDRLAAEMSQLYPGQVVGVYFTEFVMQ